VCSHPVSVKIRDRMLYASTRGAVIDSANATGLSIGKKLELEEVDEFTPAFLRKEMYPDELTPKAMFRKPMPPGRKPPASYS